MIRVVLLGVACIVMVSVRATTDVPKFDAWWWIWIIATIGFAWLWGWASARHVEHRRR